MRASLVIACLLLCTACREQPADSRAATASAPAAVLPTELAWRTLLEAKPVMLTTSQGAEEYLEWDLLNPLSGGILTGRFAADVDGDCLLLIQKGHSNIVLPDGTFRPVGFRTIPHTGKIEDEPYESYAPIECIAWDYDRDGIDDIVVRGYGSDSVADTRPRTGPGWREVPDPEQMAVFNLASEFLGNTGTDRMDWAARVDFDGDGFAELVCVPLTATTPVQVPVLGLNAEQTGSIELLPRGYPGFACDVNGDGREEYVRYESTTSKLRAYRLGGAASDLADWDIMQGAPANSLSLDSSTRRITGNILQLYDPARKHIVRIDSGLDYRDALVSIGAVSLPDGQRVLVIPHGSDILKDKLSFFNRGGSKLGTIELSEPVGPFITTLESAGKCHIVVMTERALLIYP